MTKSTLDRTSNCTLIAEKYICGKFQMGSGEVFFLEWDKVVPVVREAKVGDRFDVKLLRNDDGGVRAIVKAEAVT